MYQVLKRDGRKKDFDLSKITHAIEKAFNATKRNYTEDILNALSLRACSDFESKVKNNEISVEAIQDSVEKILADSGYADVAKAYILYRKQHENIRQISKTQLDYAKVMNSYLDVTDWRVKENSTVTYSIGALILSNSGAITANYWLSEIYDQEIANAHRDGDIHIHDLSMLTGYCAGWSLKQLIQEGILGVNGKISSKPAKHLTTLCNQMVNFLGIMQNEWAGAQAFSSFDTYLAPFIKIDNLSYKQVKQSIQSFVFGVNTPSRWGTQSPFTNITLDWVVPNDLAELPAIVGGKEQDFKYKDCQKEMNMVNKAFIEVMLEGDADGRGFQYPIPTYSITKDFDWSETENNKLLFEMTAKYGTPYFSNYVNSDMEPSDVRSMAILGTQEVIYKDQFGRISKTEIRHLVHNWINAKTKKPIYKMLMNGKFIDVIDMFEVPYEKYDSYVSIELTNGYTQSFSYEHKCPIIRNGQYMEVESQTLQMGDNFLVAKLPYDESNIGDYISGKILGYYIAEGWVSHSDREINFAINIKSKNIVNEIKDYFQKIGCRIFIETHEDKNIYKVFVYGKQAYGLMKNFVDGKSAKEKHLKTTIYDTSYEFRKGVYDGYLATDGSQKNKVFAHTTNKQLCKDFIILGATIGKYFRYQVNKNNTRYFKKDKSDKINFTSYKLYIEDPKEYNEDFYMIEISKVVLLPSKSSTVYNFTVDTKEHLYTLPNGIITHQCCRLRLDLRELRRKSGGFFGSGESTGSVGVVTINLPRIAYLSKNQEDFYNRLDKLMDISAKSLKIKRNVISKLLDQGLYPYTKKYLGSFDNHFSTIGLIGMNEVGLNAKWLRKDLTNTETQKFAKEVLNHMRERLSDYQEQYGDLYNLEATPAESTTYRFAKHDVEKYPDIITASQKGHAPYYTNSSHLPVGYTEDIFEALDIQDELQTLYTSGTVFHAFLGEKLPTWQSAANLVRKIAENYRLPYYTMSPTYSICPEHGYITGEEPICPICGKPTEVWSRITGYYRPVQNWNDGKAEEFSERKVYSIIQNSLKQNDSSDNKETLEKEQSFDNKQSLLLFTTKTCPNCKIVKSMLDSNNVDYQTIDADENVDLVKEFEIMQAPTLIIFNNDQSYEKFSNASNIIKILNQNNFFK